MSQTNKEAKPKLVAARYGKSNVRVLRVVRDEVGGTQDVVEYNVTLLVEGDLEARFAYKSS
jgi:urate oxidase